MIIQKLTKAQRNEVFEYVTAAGLDPQQFRWRETDSRRAGERIPVIAYGSGEYHMTFDVGGPEDYVSFISHVCPGVEIYWQEVAFGTRGAQVRAAERWVGALRAELDTPDLWAAVAEERRLAEAVSEIENSQFSGTEAVRIREIVTEVKRMVLAEEKGAPEETLARIEAKLDYASDAAGRMGRKDWAMIFMSVLTSLALDGLARVDSVKAALRLAAKLLGLSNGGGSLLAP